MRFGLLHLSCPWLQWCHMSSLAERGWFFWLGSNAQFISIPSSKIRVCITPVILTMLTSLSRFQGWWAHWTSVFVQLQTDVSNIHITLQNNDPCWNNPCTHTCIPSSSDPRSYVCTCPVGYVLMKDRRTCVECHEEETPQHPELPVVVPEAEFVPYKPVSKGPFKGVKGGVKG